MFSPSLLPSLAVSLSPPLAQFLCVHTRADELEGRREGHATEAYSVAVLCVTARVECPALTRRRRERRLVAQGSCRPICPSFLRAGRLTDASSSQMSDGVFASNLGLLVFPSPPSSDIEVLSSCVRSCAIPTQVTSFPFTDRARCLGEWVAGVRSEPRAGMSSRCCCPPGAGCWVSGIGSWGKCSRQVCGKFGKLQKQKASSLIPSVVSSAAPRQKEGMGCGRQVGREGSRYSFQVRPTRSPLAPSPKGYDEAQEIMALKTVFLYV